MNFIKPLLLLSNNIFLILLGLFVIGLIIGFHELGHFLFGKLFKIHTPAFSIGFGPKIYKKKIGETEFSIAAIPLGGYVESDKKSFESKPYYQKMMVIGGGIAFNLLFAYITFILLFMFGIPKNRLLYPINTIPVIESINKDKEIQGLNIENGDRIITIDNTKIANNTKIIFEKLKNLKNRKIILEVERDGKQIEITASSKILIQALGQLKIMFKLVDKPGTSLFPAIKNGINLTNAYILNTLYMFKHMFTKRDVSGVGGPIMIISATMKSASQGIKVFFLLLAIISISLAIINLVPLPILDGGQALLYTIEAIFRKPLSEKTKEFILIASWILMMVLLLLISARDVWRLIKPNTQQKTEIGKK